MIDSGLEEVSEQLHTVPAKHKIVRQIRRKYKCTRCYSGLITAPLPPRIAPGSSLSDSFIIEAGITKFYSLIPAERYAGMISHSGLEDFPPQLVLAAQHYLADFLRPVYLMIQKSIQSAVVLHADESPHKMLERSESKSWFNWAFNALGSYYFEIHPTRSGDVAIEFLAKSMCRYLMSDVYTGYEKALRVVNMIRKTEGRPLILCLYCNSHSRRKFVEAAVNYPEEAQFYIDQYEKIYTLEAELKLLKDPRSKSEKRTQMKPFFRLMAKRAKLVRESYSNQSSIVKAIDYFLKNYKGLTRFLTHHELPIDNNSSERQLRSPAVGRKVWYGTHSERGVETTEILFTVMQTCRLMKLDPRKYLYALKNSIINGGSPFTPSQYLESIPDKKIG